MEQSKLDIAAISVSARIPDFWSDQPRLWFIQVEAVLQPQRLSDESKYNLIIAKLGKEVIQQVLVRKMSTYEPHAYFTGNVTDKEINPILSKVGDFTPFYIAIAICSVILGSLIILNVICCCSRYSDYWLDRHTGNRWIVSIWSATPHKQPPLDFTELESQHNQVQYVYPEDSSQYFQRHRSEVTGSVLRQPLTGSQEYLELHKRESDI